MPFVGKDTSMIFLSFLYSREELFSLGIFMETWTDMEIHLDFNAYRMRPLFKLEYLKSGFTFNLIPSGSLCDRWSGHSRML